MTQPTPPYGVPSGYPPGHPPPRPKPRPSGWWFAVGVGLIVVALVAGVGLFVWTLSGFLDTDARVAADGRPHEVTVGTDGDRMLWKSEDLFDPGCRISDAESGEQIPLRSVGGDFSRSTPRGDWVAAYRFDPGSGRIVVTCAQAGPLAESVEIGPAPRVASFVLGILATILVPLLLGLAGLAVLIVTGILWTVRPARKSTSG